APRSNEYGPLARAARSAGGPHPRGSAAGDAGREKGLGANAETMVARSIRLPVAGGSVHAPEDGIHAAVCRLDEGALAPESRGEPVSKRGRHLEPRSGGTGVAGVFRGPGGGGPSFGLIRVVAVGRRARSQRNGENFSRRINNLDSNYALAGCTTG